MRMPSRGALRRRAARKVGRPPRAAAGCDQEVNERTDVAPHKVREEVSKKEIRNPFEPRNVRVSLPRRAEE